MEKTQSQTQLEIAQIYERVVKQAIQIRLTQNKYAELQCVEFKLSPQTDAAVAEVWTKNSTHKLWVDFKKEVEDSTAKSKHPFQLSILDVSQTYIAQSFPITPYALGRSVNIDGVSRGSGTMGGYLIVTDKEKQDKVIFGLTNNHVVNMSKATQGQDTNPVGLNKNSIIIPSQDDFKTAKADVLKKRVTDVTVPESPFSVGTVEHASGRRITSTEPYRLLDWALVHSSQKTFQDDRNVFKKDYKVNGVPKSDIPKALAGKLPVKRIVSRNSRIQPGDIVFKFGRTTGWTQGVIHYELHKINLEEAETWKGTIHNPNNIKESEELFVSSQTCKGFCEGGDSSSWILNEQGELAGLLWGKYGGCVFITDIHTVLDSIRELCNWQNKDIDVLGEL